MKQIIEQVLQKHGAQQINLGSTSAQLMLAEEITTKLKSNGLYNPYSKIELEEQKAKESWVCQTCGKFTFETEYDYLVHPKLHLGCALKEEMKGKDIKEQYHEASKSYFNDKRRITQKDWRMRENPQLELMLDVRTKDSETVEGPEGVPYTHEEIEAWNRQIEDCGTQQKYDKYRRQLSEEIVDDKNKKYLYESQDGGQTIYRREFQKTEKEVVDDFQRVMNERKNMVEYQKNNKLSDRSIEHMKSKYKDFEESDKEEQWSGKYEDFAAKDKQVDKEAIKNVSWYENWKKDNFNNEK